MILFDYKIADMLCNKKIELKINELFFCGRN